MTRRNFRCRRRNHLRFRSYNTSYCFALDLSFGSPFGDWIHTNTPLLFVVNSKNLRRCWSQRRVCTCRQTPEAALFREVKQRALVRRRDVAEGRLENCAGGLNVLKHIFQDLWMYRLNKNVFTWSEPVNANNVSRSY